MASRTPANGPGRATSRARAVARPTTRQGARPGASRNRTGRIVRPEEGEAAPVTTAGLAPRLVRSVGMTRRAIAFMVVVAVLVLSYASSLRVYLRQERDLAAAQQQIAERTAANAQLADEINRWKDPDFVRAQARQRLGWVVPGETGYRVIDANGQPLNGGVTIQSTSTVPAGEHATQWWDRLAGSLNTSDAPLAQPSATPSTVGSASVTPTPKSTAKTKR